MSESLQDARKTSISDEAFMEQFEDCTLPTAVFDHYHHVKLAWLYLQRFPLLEAVANFSAGIKRYATAKGAADRYHETITWAFLFLIHQRHAAGGESPLWEAFAAANSDLLNWQENILKRYYCEETLQSAEAKRMFVLPDRLRDS